MIPPRGPGEPDDGTGRGSAADDDEGTLADAFALADDGRTPSRHHVTFGVGAVVVGFLVGVVTLALVFALRWGSGGLGIFVIALWYGLGIGLVTGLPLGVVVGYLLRPVRNQWIHVGVFFAVFAVAAFVVAALLSPSTALGDGLPTALVIGGAGALARASVWRLVRTR
ncbi:hypothetical protein ASF21_00455 [Arthrobacter sp. Leaf234]|uniref:hypothetical protein n=1 Tax=Arthrobacter sp. Leaf234 TaxID=1736303 RepID=UPI0006F3C967|nr:hypothetical protein [Arthrobacter sp. Leaf234]KQO02869.1 hypothetical protein ASF21_00455 [Arthrobacter sp. Leaf234]